MTRSSLLTALVLLVLTCVSTHARAGNYPRLSDQQIQRNCQVTLVKPDAKTVAKCVKDYQAVADKMTIPEFRYCYDMAYEPGTKDFAKCMNKERNNRIRDQRNFEQAQRQQWQIPVQQQQDSSNGGAGIDYNLLSLGLSMMGNHAPAPTHTTCYRTGDLVNCDSR